MINISIALLLSSLMAFAGAEQTCTDTLAIGDKVSVDLNRAAKAKFVSLAEATLTIGAACNEVCVEVDILPAADFIGYEADDQHFVKMNGKVVANGASDGFELKKSGDLIIGWSVCFTIPNDLTAPYWIKIHTLAQEEKELQTAGTPDGSILLCLDCTQMQPDEKPEEPVPTQTDPIIEPKPECGDDEACKPENPSPCLIYTCNEGKCEINQLPNGSSCGKPVGICRSADSCMDGVCQTDLFHAAGTACGSSEVNECTDQDTCDGKGNCLANDKPDGEPCGTPPTACSKGSSCSTGKCEFQGFEPVTTSCGNKSSSVCDADDHCDGFGECVDAVADEGTLCRPADGLCDVEEVCDGTSKLCPADIFAAAGTSCGSNLSNECTKEDTCDGQGSCLDNHVDNGTPCGDPATQCNKGSSCSVGECVFNGFEPETTSCGNKGDGLCDLDDHCNGAGYCVDAVAESGKVCRAATGDCDIAETCDGVSSICPDDVFKALDSPCGDSSMTDCTSPDTCDGQGTCLDNHVDDETPCGKPATQCNKGSSCSVGECVFNGFEPETTACGNKGDGLCDLDDHCNGAGHCVDAVAESGTLCRAAAGECDIAETCDGVSSVCPDDIFKAVDSPCGDSSMTECTSPDTCDGNGLCLENHEPDGKTCGDAATECSKGHSCSIGQCKFLGFEPSTKKCGTIEGVCDDQDFCSGNSDECTDNVLKEGTLCRASAGDCDLPEACDGSSKSCPEDAFKDAGVACGNKDLAYCEIQDTCDGNGGCTDNGDESLEYSFKCGTTNYLCGDDLALSGSMCQENVKTTEIPTKADCADLITALNDDTVDIYKVPCPNGNAVSHYVRYDCQGVSGTKCELDGDGAEKCSTCNRRNLRGIFA